MLQYNRSKFCNMLHMTYLHSKLSDKGVSVNSVHPGNMVPTGIDRQWWFWKLVFILGRPFTKTITQGAATQLFCLVHPDAANISGSYFNQCCPFGPIPASINMTYAIELNTLSRNLVKDFLTWNDLLNWNVSKTFHMGCEHPLQIKIVLCNMKILRFICKRMVGRKEANWISTRINILRSVWKSSVSHSFSLRRITRKELGIRTQRC